MIFRKWYEEKERFLVFLLWMGYGYFLMKEYVFYLYLKGKNDIIGLGGCGNIWVKLFL